MIAVGVCLAVLAAALGTTSKQLIAYSEHVKKPWIFHIGATMNIAVGPIVDASAYAFAPQVIVAPFACLDVIFNALTAPYTLRWQNEKLSKNHLIGTCLVFAGAVATSLFAQADNVILTVYELEEQLFFRPTSVAYLTIELTAILSIEWAIRGKMLQPAVRGIALGVIAGVLMGNVFFMKGLIGIIQTTSRTSYHAWLRPTPYILTAFAAGGAVAGHIFMRKGLGEYKGVFMVTIFEGAHITAACFSGCVVMEEMAGAPWWRYILYWVSVCCIIAGLLVINLQAAEAQMQKQVEEKTHFHIAQSFAEHEEEGDSEGLRKRPDVPLDELNSDGLVDNGLVKTTIGRNIDDIEDGDGNLTPRQSRNGGSRRLRPEGNGASRSLKLAEVSIPPPPKSGVKTQVASDGASVSTMSGSDLNGHQELIDFDSPAPASNGQHLSNVV
eukprot:TRINITY_DN26924_c0_g1_i1.p1 TRINITY_DN26924_c0_g1~~TRINITY_DN26924_c0_g1_i1.p1  ORF type:complete len:440 (-),score=101.91 TRINITY_DN26924_c0_g1_i1:155-1474(-)